MVRLEKLDEVINRLNSVTCGMTVWETRDSHPETARTAVYRGRAFKIDLPRAVVEIVTDDCWVDDIIRRMPRVDGRIEVLPIEASYHVRNGFMDL